MANKKPKTADRKPKTADRKSKTGASRSDVALSIRKAFKMYVGGAFVRSESGRYFQVSETKAKGESGTYENVPLGSRKDTRDAVKVAYEAFGGWSKRVAANRGQILYRLAEMTDARRS